MMAFGPIVILALCALSVWMGIAAVLRVCRVPRAVEPGGSCGRCGYAYTHWTRCPECGSEVSTVGIATPWLMFRHRGSMPGALFALTLMAFAMAFLLTGLTVGLCQFAGWNQHTRQSGMSTLQPPPINGRPQPLPQVSFLVHREVVGPSVNSPTRGEVVLVLLPKGATLAMTADRPDTTGAFHILHDVKDGQFVTRSDAGETIREGKGIQIEDVADWLERAGVAFDEEERRVAAAQILQEIDSSHAGALAVIGPGNLGPRGVVLASRGFSTRSIPSLPFAVVGLTGMTGITIVTSVASAVIYIVALWWVVTRRRRLMSPERSGA